MYLKIKSIQMVLVQDATVNSEIIVCVTPTYEGYFPIIKTLQ